MPEAHSTRQPLFWAALAFAAGIILGVYFWRPMSWWAVAAAMFTLAAAWFRSAQGWRNYFAYFSAFTALAALGAWTVQARDAAFRLPDLSAFTDNQKSIITAHVMHDGIVRGTGALQRQTVDVETEQISRDGTTTAISAAVRLSFYGPGEQLEKEQDFAPDGSEAEAGTGQIRDVSKAPQLRVFTYGQRLRFPAKLRAPRNFQNPGAWDYRGYLLKQGIVATGSAAARTAELLPGFQGSRIQLWGSRARRAIIGKIHLLWPRAPAAPPHAPAHKSPAVNEDQAALFDAMLMGERSFIGRETNAAWQRTGIYHILVVSGMNIGILALVIFAMLRRVRAGQLLATVLTILVSAGYAWLAELGAPVMRSVLMVTVFLLTRLLYRNHSLLNAIGAAALVLLVAEPRTLFDASFQLTFLSVVAIAGLAVPILERTSAPYRRGLHALFLPAYDVSLRPPVAQLRLDIRMFSERIAALLPVQADRGQRAVGWLLGLAAGFVLGIYEVIVVSASAQLAMTLPMALYFHRATVVGLAANTIAVPLTGILMMTAALALGISFVWMSLAQLPALMASWSLLGITSTIRILGGLHIADLRLPAPSTAQVLVVAASLVVAMLLIRRRPVLAAAGMAALMGTSVWITVFPPPPQLRSGVLEVTGIDVGQAESTLIVTPQGRIILVDTAGPLGPFVPNFDFGEDLIAPYLWSRGIRQIDAMVLTHAHSDHMGGMPGVITALHPRELWLGPNAQTPELRRLLQNARDQGVRVVARRAGDSFDYGGARFEVLAPPPDWEVKEKPRNNDSLVLRVSLGGTSALLTADAEKQIERYLTGLNPRATVLKVGHNGSNTSTTPEFLAAVQPRFALISAGMHNSFRHPRKEVLERLRNASIATYRTDLMGAVTFLLDGENVTATPEVLRQLR